MEIGVAVVGHAQEGIGVYALGLSGLALVVGASQSLEGVVFVGLAQEVPESLFHHSAQQPTGVVLGDAEGVSDGSKEINVVSLGIFEMSELDGLLPESFTSVIVSEVV